LCFVDATFCRVGAKGRSPLLFVKDRQKYRVGNAHPALLLVMNQLEVLLTAGNLTVLGDRPDCMDAAR